MSKDRKIDPASEEYYRKLIAFTDENVQFKRLMPYRSGLDLIFRSSDFKNRKIDRVSIWDNVQRVARSVGVQTEFSSLDDDPQTPTNFEMLEAYHISSMLIPDLLTVGYELQIADISEAHSRLETRVDMESTSRPTVEPIVTFSTDTSLLDKISTALGVPVDPPSRIGLVTLKYSFNNHPNYFRMIQEQDSTMVLFRTKIPAIMIGIRATEIEMGKWDPESRVLNQPKPVHQIHGLQNFGIYVSNTF